MKRNRPHEKRRDAIPDPCPSGVVAAPDLVCLRVGGQRLRFIDRQLAGFPTDVQGQWLSLLLRGALNRGIGGRIHQGIC